MTRPPSDPPIFPFFVGCGRSGTTLVRAMFDSHPDMAVPDESNFVVRFGRARERYERPWGFAGAVFLDDLFRHSWFRRSGISHGMAWEAFDARPPADLPAAIREVFGLYAGLSGKSRYGDKTPSYVLHIPLLADLFPEARFVHVIRDGRAVALSLLDVGFGPRSLAQAALQWRERVGLGLAFERELGPGRCRHVRYEDLIEDPAGTLEPLCEFVGLEFDPAMLRYFERADSIVSSDVYKYRSVRLPPTKNLRDWRSQMSRRDLALFESIGGDLLEEAGYERGIARPSPAARVDARARVLATKLRRAPRDLRNSARRRNGHNGAAPFAPIVSEAGDGRHQAVSFLLAREAAEDERVAAFRSEVLDDRLLPIDEVEDWVAGRAAGDGDPDRRAGAIEYLGSHGVPLRRPTTQGEALERLRRLGAELVERYGWEPYQATTFVLTDLVPVVEPIRSRISGGRPLHPPTRLVLDVDPSVSPAELAKRYKTLRRQLFPGRVPHIEDRRLRLAVFVANRPAAGWDELLAAWNDDHPSWAYEHLADFQRDARLTRQRLVETAW
jgi:sulfotransferase family protein